MSRPQGLFGGHSGTCARYVLDPGEHTERVLPSKTPYVNLVAGTLVHVQSAGGGGLGDPRTREPDRVAQDLKSGYISDAVARDTYGYQGTDEAG